MFAEVIFVEGVSQSRYIIANLFYTPKQHYWEKWVKTQMHLRGYIQEPVLLK